MKVTKYPADLALTVQSAIKSRSSVPSLEALISLFETMFFASIKTEESEPIIFNIVYLDSKNPDIDPPKIKVQDRWEYVKLKESIILNLSNAIKLARASDPRTSSLAVYHDENDDIFIWGLIDQGNRYYEYINYEYEEGPERPGIFQASIEGTGHLVAYNGYQKIAELRVSSLIRRDIDIFQKGPIKESLDLGLNQYLQNIRQKAWEEAYNADPDWDKSLTQYWFSTICRLILRIKSYRHGGAIIFSSGRANRGLNVKYPINYNRLKRALISRGVKIIDTTFASNMIGVYLDEEHIPAEFYIEENTGETALKHIRSEIDGVLWFISLLSRVDGLVLMNKHLIVRGFGVEINSAKLPGSVYTCSQQIPSESSLEYIDYNHFGTRHRSMIRYCWNYPGSVGFVISQDGDVRAMTKYEDKLVIWDNIRLQAYKFVRRKLIRKRILKTKKKIK